MKKKLTLLVLCLCMFTALAACKTKTPASTSDKTDEQSSATYTITFADQDETVLQRFEVANGELPEYTGEEPTKEATAQYTYAFIGWDKQIVPATEDITYTATYSETLNTYEVVFADFDGVTLETQTLEYGRTPAYSGTVPERTATAEYSYEFKGWDKEFVAVTENAVYTAQYNQTKNSYKVTFVDTDGTVLYQNTFEYGNMPEYDAELPSLEGNVQYSYPFNGWDKELASVTGEATYTATYKTVVNKYAITFIDEENNVLQSDDVEYGAMPQFTATLPALPESTAQYEYTGAWDKEIVSVVGDETYTYVVTAQLRGYNIRFFNEDGSKLFEKTYEYGSTPAYEGDLPEKADTERYIYIFNGWDKEIVSVVGAADYTATFYQATRMYKVTFLDENGNFLQESDLEYGSVPAFTGELPALPESTAQYEYAGAWDKEFAEVTEAATYTYSISKAIRKYVVIVNHYDLDGNVVSPKFSDEMLYNDLWLYNGYYEYTAPEVAGKAASLDRVYYTLDENGTIIDIYYSDVVTWDKESVSEALGGSGSEEEPYLIASGADLAYLKCQVDGGNAFAGKYFKMTKSIDLNGSSLMIGSSDELAFGGIFDGNNCSIRGVGVQTAEAYGLFYALLAGGEIKNLSVYGNLSCGTNYSGAIVSNNMGTVTNCINYASLTTTGRAGGIAGQNTGIIEACANYGSVTLTGSSTNMVAGIVMYSSGGKLLNCKNFGTVKSENKSGWNTAGIVSNTTAACTDVENCVNYGAIIGTKSAGGLIGESYTANINGCANYGSVSASSDGVGGIVRVVKSALSMTNCYNFGTITYSYYTGGIIGELQASAEIVSCANYGYLNSGDYAGGIIGFIKWIGSATTVNVSECNNYGKIEVAKNQAVGILGRPNSNGTVTISNCGNYGELLGKAGAGVCVGWIQNGHIVITGCYNYGTMSGTECGFFSNSAQATQAESQTFSLTCNDCVDHTGVIE